jgi:hypothetical protein
MTYLILNYLLLILCFTLGLIIGTNWTKKSVKSDKPTICADFGGDNMPCVWGGILTCGEHACKFVKREESRNDNFKSW